MKTKQVIVFRKDLLKGDKAIRKGKFGAMCAHAAMASLLKFFRKTKCIDNDNNIFTRFELEFGTDCVLEDWLNGLFTKVVVSVPDEQALLDLEQKCIDLDIPCALIEDAGLTEFHGVPTVTCLGIGPWDSETLDQQITGDLPLL